MQKQLQLSPFADLTPVLADGALVALDVGPDAWLYALVALRELDYRITTPGASFARSIPDAPQAYRLVALHDGDVTLDIYIPDERFNIHHVQPLPDNELLLVCARSRYRGPDDFEKNGRVYTADGHLVREFLLGDGIQQVQATRAGTIWTSYFDEGIFGNYGWKSPIGASGLTAWDVQGNLLYAFAPSHSLAPIIDCYALNVPSERSTWLYYYRAFPLVHLREQRVEAHWAMPRHGSSSFAIWREYALFCGGYDGRDELHLYELGPNGRGVEVTSVTLADEEGNPLVADSTVGRADSLYLRRGNRVYRCDVQMVVDA